MAGDIPAARRALVTGASSGIGAAFARGLFRQGWPLVLVARRADRLGSLARELGGGERVLTVPLDLTAAGALDRLEQEIRRHGLEIELLVNNAGVGHTGRFPQEPRERVLGMVDLNVRALVELTHRLLPDMVERRHGAIVNVASTAAFQPVGFMSVYAATKSFVLSFTEGLHVELQGTGVRVQALCPGLTESEFHAVSGTDRLFFTRTPRMSAEDVVACSLRGLERGRLRVVAGWSNRLLAALQGWFPRPVVRRVAASLFRPSAAGDAP